MKQKLYLSNKLEVRKSKLHGWGVFATQDIPNNEIIEESLTIPILEEISDDLKRYRYVFDNKKYFGLGFAGIYNSAKSKEKSNLKRELVDDMIVFITTKEIKKDEELLLYYYNSVLYYILKGNKDETK
tara:strand:- start:919 stop:1302 length:384 start_codon:yes stop_codon:yes gene_type:complete